VYSGVDRRERRKRAMDALDRVGLAAAVGTCPPSCPAGSSNASRCEGHRHRPRAAARRRTDRTLDSQSTADVLTLFDELSAQGRTIMVITHEHEVAAGPSD